MELRELKYFLAVVQQGSISGAAEYLYITQPSLSRQMQHLESEVGGPLFVRGSRRITLTERGRLLKKRAEEMLEQMRKAVEDLSIEKILQMEHIGISNACLRLKMKSQNTARFLFESEQGVGSCVTVRIPVEKLKKLERSGKKST